MKNFITKHEVKWAIIFTVAALLWMVIEKMAGWHEPPGIENHATYTNIFSIIAIVIFVFALRDVKQNRFEGNMDWKQGFLSGLGISVIVMLLTPLSQYLTHYVISPDYFQNAIDLGIEKGEDKEYIESFFTLKNYMIISAVGAVVMGAATSAIVAIFLKSK
ncbi:MAG: DUF4199 domain-containing protein [Saprospiraceae bacterium]